MHTLTKQLVMSALCLLVVGCVEPSNEHSQQPSELRQPEPDAGVSDMGVDLSEPQDLNTLPPASPELCRTLDDDWVACEAHGCLPVAPYRLARLDDEGQCISVMDTVQEHHYCLFHEGGFNNGFGYWVHTDSQGAQTVGSLGSSSINLESVEGWERCTDENSPSPICFACDLTQ